MKKQSTTQKNWTKKSMAAIAGTSMAAVALAGVGTASSGATTSAADRFGGSKKSVAKAATLKNDRYLPVHNYRVSAGWGNSSGPHAGRKHAGIDLAARTNEPVYAAEKGKVVVAGWNGGYGQLVKIKHSDGRYTLYAHLNKMNVKKGQKVKTGQRIGAVGSTGYSTGAHLHFEVRSKKDRPVNPNKYLGASRADLQKLTKKLSRKS